MPQAQRAIVQAARLRAQGKLADAESGLRKLLRTEPRSQPALHLLGLLRFERGDAAEAMKLLERATTLVPNDVDAWRNWGNVSQDSGSIGQAEICFRRVLEHQPGDIAARGNLALLLETAGKLKEAASELRTLLKFAPAEHDAKRILVRVLRSLRQHQEEVTLLRDLVLRFPQEKELATFLSRSYFLLFDSVDRDVERAKQVLAEWHAFDPHDPVCLHMLAAHAAKQAPARASDQYVERHFDEFAPSFDEVLKSLDYRGPALVREALEASAPEPQGAFNAVDLGCGTGLVGPLVKPWVRSLVGVDLSQGMLDQAKTRGVYDELRHEEITSFVNRHVGAFDLALCTETLLYFGQLTDLVAGVARALRPGGRFIATIELLDGDASDFVLHTAGRYAHSAKYMTESLVKAGFTVERSAVACVREQYGQVVTGLVVTGKIP